MKSVLLLFAFLAGIAAQAQQTNTQPVKAPPAPLVQAQRTNASPVAPMTQTPTPKPALANTHTANTELPGAAPSAAESRAAEAIFQLERPNEMSVGKVTLSGISIEAVKTRNPLQMLSPFAPPEYGSPEDNVVRDVITHRAAGLKIFAIRF
jgi:hypothetical protein